PQADAFGGARIAGYTGEAPYAWEIRIVSERHDKSCLLLASRSPLPHAEHGFLRQWMTCLARQHTNLPAMMRIMRDQVSKETPDLRAKAFYSPICLHRRWEHGGKRGSAFLQRFHSLRRSDLCAIELLGNLAAFGCRFQPHHAHIVHVGYYSRDRSALVPRR